MKKLMIIVFLFNILFAQMIDQKMVISAKKESADAARSLYELEKFFQENRAAKELQAQEHLELSMELLDDYVLTVIKPIKTVSLKNQLKLLLQTKYPHAFIVQNRKKNSTSTPVSVEKKKVRHIALKKHKPEIKKGMKNIVQKNSLIRGLSNEWLALIILALAGLFLVYRSARQINKIKKLQKKLETYQEKVATQMDYIGEQYE